MSPENPLPTSQFPLEKLLSLLLTQKTPQKTLTFWLKNAWKSDPVNTLELISHLCSHNKEGFYAAAIWLHQNHPLTLACSIGVFVNFGCLKDSLEILRAILADDHEEGEPEKEKATKEGEIARARRVVCKYRYDSDYRYLHERVSELFADALQSDLEFLKSGEAEKVSFASEYCPSIDSPYDKSTLKSLSQPKASVRSSRNKTKGVDKRFRFYVRIAAEYANVCNGSSFLAHHFIYAFKNLGERLEEVLLKRENLKNSIAVCYTSGSKNAATIDIRIAMSLLISELSENPWKSKTFTFSEHPKLWKIEGDSPHSKGQFIKKHLASGEKIDFGKVFDRILQAWMTERLSKDQMVKRVFVFSERGFDEGAKNFHKGEYREVWEGYGKRGHKTVPEIAFCSLRDCVSSTLTVCGPKGVVSTEEVMVGGFLKSLASLYLGREGVESADVLMESIRKQREDAVVRTQKQRDDALRLTQCGGEKCNELDPVVLD
ncbi:hypothetical protein RHMOL_Rhmol05G0110300 [Rhododendron molle]|uniref:Uncharacterized protein n=1 Tax=Rhododendron molle TaxID=49168 RepID=A0ACC0NMJ4_RHOML|nr:hypothetical protein RHMOL_Rhmol05G0110300 [Rhododendron molle]